MAEFYLADEKHKAVSGSIVEHKDVLYFKQDKSGYDGKATAEHVKNYRDEFKAFKDANPDYVLPESFYPVEIGSPEVTRQAPTEIKVELPESDLPSEDKKSKKRP